MRPHAMQQASTTSYGIGGTVSGGTSDFQNAYTFGDLNQMIKVAQRGTSGGDSVMAKSTAFGYDDREAWGQGKRRSKPARSSG